MGGTRHPSDFAVMTAASGRHHRDNVCRPPSDRKSRMGATINRLSHNAPDNMATNSPKRPAVANNASFAMP